MHMSIASYYRKSASQSIGYEHNEPIIYFHAFNFPVAIYCDKIFNLNISVNNNVFISIHCRFENIPRTLVSLTKN